MYQQGNSFWRFVTQVLALLDMSLCSFYLLSFEDFNKQTFRLQTQVSYSVLNEGESYMKERWKFFELFLVT